MDSADARAVRLVRRMAMAMLGAVLLLAGIAVTDAAAEKRIVAASPNRFTTPNVTMDQGERLIFENQDFVSHNVTSTQEGPDGQPLFRSPTISRSEAFVEGSQYLTTGSYGFFCGIHPSTMRGTLEVTSSGTPVPRPPPSPPPPTEDTTAPELELSILDRSLRTVLRRGALRVRASIDEAARVAATAQTRARRRTVTIASARATFGGRATRVLSLRLTRAGRQALRRVRRARITVAARGTDASGNSRVARASRTLGR